MSQQRKKVIFAAGGTGGHLFPAQALAEQLLKETSVEILFAGALLSGNKYFDRAKFAYRDVASMTPFRGGLLKVLRSLGTLLSGIYASIRLLKRQKPDLVIGFGSFHAFPVLCAAVFCRIPMVLFESNSIPGKVVRLFSKKALFTGIFFPEAQKHLRGNVIEVEIPQKKREKGLAKEEAREQFGLKADLHTLLVFGGSQGAKRINQTLLELLPLLQQKGVAFQLIHFTGSEETASHMIALCQQWNVPCYIKPFEPQMDIAWQAADVAICRAGAMTLSELIHYEVPGILIPYPFAADGHQLKNALFLEKKVGGASYLLEEELTAQRLLEKLTMLHAEEKKKGIRNFKAEQTRTELSHHILKLLRA